jgi:hypothetical protein
MLQNNVTDLTKREYVLNYASNLKNGQPAHMRQPLTAGSMWAECCKERS